MKTLFSIIWYWWIDEGWTVEKVYSWRTARLRCSNGKKLVITVMPLATLREWRKHTRVDSDV